MSKVACELTNRAAIKTRGILTGTATTRAANTSTESGARKKRIFTVRW
jgi:hypothetical protein